LDNIGGADANLTILNTSGTSPGYNTGTLGAVAIVASASSENKIAIQGLAGGDGGDKQGVRGFATGLGTNYGVKASASGGTLNNAVNAVGTATGTSQAMGVYATAQGTTSGNTYGVYGQNGSNATGLAYAGYFQNLNSSGTPYGLRSDVSSSSATQYGVYTGMNTAAAGGTKYGYYANVSGGANNWAAYFAAGNVYIADNLVIPTNAGVGKVLTSDAVGIASWQNAAWSKYSNGSYNYLLNNENNNTFTRILSASTLPGQLYPNNNLFEIYGNGQDRSMIVNDSYIELGDVDGGQAGTKLIIDPEANENFQFLSGNVGIASAAPTSSLEVNGSFAKNVLFVEASGTVTLDENSSGIIFDGGGGALNVLLPDAANCKGRIYHFTVVNAGNNQIDLTDVAGHPIFLSQAGGQSTETIPASSGPPMPIGCSLISSGTGWYAISSWVGDPSGAN